MRWSAKLASTCAFPSGTSPGSRRRAGRSIARRNLSLSILAEFLGFCVWALWSVVVPLLPALVRQRIDRLTRAATELSRLSPLAQVARREESLRERGRRLNSTASTRLARSRNDLAKRRAADRLDRALTERFASATRGLEHRRQRLVALSPDGVHAWC